MRTVDVLVFDGVEELDFVGPWEVFGVAGGLFPDAFRVSLIADGTQPIQGAYGLRVHPEFTLDEAPPPDVVIVPGGRGARVASQSPRILDFVKAQHGRGVAVASVCTGALVLAAAGLLDGKRATTHWAVLEELRRFPRVLVERARFIDNGDILTSAGISAGIDLALHLVDRFVGPGSAQEVAHMMEYVPRSDGALAEPGPSGDRAVDRSQAVSSESA